MDKIYIGNPSIKGLQKFLLPFNIDNEAFATLFNFYAWRGRIKRKRGTVAVGRLQKQVVSVLTVTPPLSWQVGQILTLDGSGNGSANLRSVFSLGSTASIVPGSIHLTDGTNTFIEPATPDGTLVGTPAGSGTINYATGELTITGGAAAGVLRGVATSATPSFSYYPDIPVLGLEDFITTSTQYPLLLAFDQKYAYQISNLSVFFNVSYYKGSNNPVVWSGQNYQQFWTTNYQGALWATNGKPGFNFVTGTYVSGTGTMNIVITISGTGAPTLVVGDVLWFNEWGSNTINLQTGTVSVVSGPDYTVTFTTNVTASATGLVQTLTAGVTGQDGIRWYDGDMTGASGIPASTSTGWVNFAPPLTAGTVTIDDNGPKKYYLVGANSVVPFKDRLVFFSPWIQASTGNAVQLPDVALWSWNGTPYYSTLTPTGQTSDPTAYYVDQTGKGGWLSAGIDQYTTTVVNNEDVLLVGFTQKQTRFVYTGNDLFPFLFYIINSELGTASTFSGITLDRGALAFGLNGLTLTTQVSSERIDIDIPDQVFQIKGPATVNAAQRISAARDFYHEWVYFTFVPNDSMWSFPTLTLQYNYRENAWSFNYENFTAHGQYRKQTGYTWATIPFRTWATWRESWNSATTTALFPSVVAGNPQGFVVIKGQGTGEAPTGYIATIANASGFVQITSTDHCVAVGDYLYFSNAIGITYINTIIGCVTIIVDANNFVVDIPYQSGTYYGLGVFSRLSQPLLQTKQFAPYWNEGRQVRLGVQKYLLDYTDNAQCTLNIYLSQDPEDAWNSDSIVPDPQTLNNSLVYSNVLYTSPEPNNLQTPTATSQYQIWHRNNTSLIGDSFQIGLTLSDAQMRNLNYATSEITLHVAQFDVDKGPYSS